MRVKEMDELVFVWQQYAKCYDSKLTQDAIDFKKRLRKYVETLPALDEITEHVFGGAFATGSSQESTDKSSKGSQKT